MIGLMTLGIYLVVGIPIGIWFWETFVPEQIGWECDGSTKVVAVGVVAMLWPAMLVCMPVIVLLRISGGIVARFIRSLRRRRHQPGSQSLRAQPSVLFVKVDVYPTRNVDEHALLLPELDCEDAKMREKKTAS